ncbi:MAG: 8-oxo-dGTP diphosphatase MutT [Woeseiaceae bacterium]
MTQIHVAAGILQNTTGEVLIAERLCDGPYNGLWEFPGGKIDAGESARAALRRELREELGIEATSVESFMGLSHEYPDRSVVLEFFLIRDWNGDPEGLEGQGLRWVAIRDLNVDELLPADAPLVDALQNRLADA